MKYRGAAHNSNLLKSNLQLYQITVIIHNMKGYDSHLFMKKIENVRVTAKGIEKYIKMVK